jgi:hypothetical protein
MPWYKIEAENDKLFSVQSILVVLYQEIRRYIENCVGDYGGEPPNIILYSDPSTFNPMLLYLFFASEYSSIFQSFFSFLLSLGCTSKICQEDPDVSHFNFVFGDARRNINRIS